jgi:TonB-dependent starch-binding outer membrane protein SusC
MYQRILFLVSWIAIALTSATAQEFITSKRSLSGLQKPSLRPLKDVLFDLGKQYDVHFLYEGAVVENRMVYYNSHHKAKLDVILQRILGTTLTFRKVNSSIYAILVPTDAPKPLTTTLQKKQAQPSSELVINQMVSGVVTDAETNQLLPGVSIVVKGSAAGTTSDVNGQYQLNVPDGATLVFSYVGYISQEVVIANQNKVDIALRVDAKSLNEVVVVGYGTQTRGDVTSAVATVKGQEIQNVPVPSPIALLQGRAAGISVIQNDGRPGGASLNVRVRGASSISAGNDPLYIIDGMQFVGGVSDFNPNDIESMEVLKDAAATAIYGSRGANGVILITTKRGKQGKPTFQLNYYTSLQQVNKNRLPKLLDNREFTELIQEQRANGTGVTSLYNFIFPTTGDQPNVNWLNEIIRPGAMNNYELSVSGGENKLRFYLSGALMKQKGVLLNSGYQRFSSKLNIDYEISSKLKIGTNINLTKSITNTNNTDATFRIALYKAPVFSVYNADGTYNVEQDASTTNNPVAVSNRVTNRNNKFRLISNAFAEYILVPGLTFRTSYGIDYIQSVNNQFTPASAFRTGVTVTNGNYSNSNDFNWINENLLTYTKTLNKHRFNGLAGYSQLENRNESSSASARDYPNENIQTLNAAATISSASSSISTNGLSSLFGRVGYIFADKYFIEASLRRDGSSKFGSNNRYALFPAASIGWQMAQEPFFSSLSRTITDLKLRASYGKTGNQAGIGNYTNQGEFATGQNYAGAGGVTPSIIANPDLKWETTAQYNVGTDISFWNGRVALTVDAYLKKTSDLLLNVILPSTSGYSSVLQNVGSSENKGLEFSLNTVNINKGGLRWNTNVNISFNRNRIVKLYGGNDIIVSRGTTGYGQAEAQYILREGYSVSEFYGWKSNGVYARSSDNERGVRNSNSTGYLFRMGDMIFVDQNGDNVINNNDRVMIGHALPKFTGGMTNNLTYKNIDLTVLAQFTYGNDLYNGSQAVSESMSQFQNSTKHVLNRWRKEGDVTDVPRADHSDPGLNKRASTRWIEDGSYLRIKTVTLGYTMPASLLKKVNLKSARLYLTAQNLLTLTRYSGIDPESSFDNRGNPDVYDLGYDYGNYPQYRTYMLGLTIGF